MSQHGCGERLSYSKGFQEEGGSQSTMEVLVETLTGTAFEMTVSPSDTIFAIKSKICRVEGIPVSQQHLLYNLKELDDASSLLAHGITDGAKLRLVLGMRGGPISTRRLPPPQEPWRDIERLLDSNRDDGDWGSASSSGCKVTVLVFRDGERVNMLRVRENRDGTYSPLEHNKYSTSLSHLTEGTDEGYVGTGTLAQNAVTQGKMIELRRRMENLSLRRRNPSGDKSEIQKTRSEETLSVPSLLDEPDLSSYTPYSEAEDSFTPLYDGNYTRYDYDCSFADRYTLLPPIRARADSDQSVHDAVAESERIKLSDALAGSILVKGGRRDAQDEAAILEECLDGVQRNSPQIAAKNLAPIPAEYGPLVGGEARGWRVRGFGSSSQLVPPAAPLAPPSAAHSHSASSLHLRHPHPHPPTYRHPLHNPPAPPLSDALFSSSTSDLEKLKRNRILPALSRHRNTEHLHLSDDHLDAAHRPRNPEAGSERRQRRIEKIAEADSFRFGDAADARREEPQPAPKKEDEKKLRVRCALCRKRLSIATVHRCRCGAPFCAPHRYAEVHGCAYDYKACAHAPLLLKAPKLPKI